MNKFIWGGWALLSIALATYFGNIIFLSDDKSDFLIGQTTHGHFQIEMACETCHTDAFGGQDVLQNACTQCHADELEQAHDSHPKKKLTDPREAYRLEIIDARYCVSCHTEHQHEQTRAMGVTLPDDYCYHCHQEVGEERESHKGLAFDSCATSGCHNFHDNRALYESFLIENAGQPWLKEVAKIASTNTTKNIVKPAIDTARSAFHKEIAAHPDIANHWQASSHAKGGVDCGGCHQPQSDEKGELNTWIAKPSIEQCASCHENEVKGFTAGKHGMRLASTIALPIQNIQPIESHLEFNEDSLHTQHSCNACHSAHEFNTRTAAVDSCLNCHADEHSLAFKSSSHGKLWQQEKNGEIPEGSGVSCATCHMPRTTKKVEGKLVISVEHNQNSNLRPNEKMIRPVCMSCHGLEFSIDALADQDLIKKNFTGKPGIHIESVDWATKRENQ